MGITVGWNFRDAVAGIMSATLLILDKASYQQTENKVKAALILFSSVQALAFSYTPWLSISIAGVTAATALAGPAFALATLIDLSIAAIDFKSGTILINE
jgi:hypothetical protein